MNYQKIYNSLIQNRINNEPEGYSEKHHIVPRCLGGSDDDDNLVRLTAKEHYMAHRLLCKIYDDNYKLKLALTMMNTSTTKQDRYKMTSRTFNTIREQISKAQSVMFSGESNPMYGNTKYIGFNNPRAKVSNVFCFKTDKLIASNVCLKPWAVENGYSDRHLAATARGERRHHKQIYARYK
jgi:hypothetical protein